jgi:porphobilinogen synthase
LLKKDLVAPFFVLPGQGKKEPILSMPGVYRLSLDFLLPELEMLQMQGLRAAALFPVVPKELKNAQAGEALNPNGLIPQAIYQIKKGHFSLDPWY